MNELTIISRKSVLAKIQATEVSEVIKKRFPEIKINFKTKDTSGDIDLATPLHKMPEMGVFTSDIREELLSDNADIAVHSWKDLPVDLEEGTEVAATIKRADLRDVLIFKNDSLKKKKIEIFTSSPRRQENLSAFLTKAFPFEYFPCNYKKRNNSTPVDSLNEKIMEPTDSQSEPTGSKMSPKGSLRKPKGTTRESKRAEREPKGNQRKTKTYQKIDLRKQLCSQR